LPERATTAPAVLLRGFAVTAPTSACRPQADIQTTHRVTVRAVDARPRVASMPRNGAPRFGPAKPLIHGNDEGEGQAH
jgi:hypothetical protein